MEYKIVPAADKVVRIIEFMAQSPTGAYGVTEIAQQLGLNKGTVYPILQTLIYHQWVEKSGGGSKYSLTNRLVGLSGNLLKGDRLISDFMLVGAELERQCGELINLHYMYGMSTAILAARVLSTAHSLRVDLPVGSMIPITASSAGKWLVCGYDDDVLVGIFHQCATRYTQATIRSQEEFLEEIHTARQQGYAFNMAEMEQGVYSVGSPIRNAQGTIIAAINIVAPQIRFSGEHREELLEAVQRGAERLSALRR